MLDKNLNESLPNMSNDGTAEMQLRRLSLFSSGVGFFEHGGKVTGSAEFDLPFNQNAINDVLKSIVITDPDASPTVTYHSEDTLLRTLKGLSVDLHSKDCIAELLNNLKGAEIEVLAPSPIKGRILLVEFRHSRDSNKSLSDICDRDAYVSLFTPQGVRVISLKEISGFTFLDKKINDDVNRALDLILQSRDSDIRNLTVKLNGSKERKVSLSYVMPTPIWKVSYRLDLSQENPFLQGWAIVDNDSDTDWENVELALVTGKPVSFIQNLYSPYYLSRPTLPLAIAGVAEAKTYDSGTQRRIVLEESSVYEPSYGAGGDVLSQSDLDSLFMSDEIEPALSVEDLLVSTQLEETDNAFVMSEGLVETAHGRNAGDQFEFTIKNPVSLARQQSAMLPLVEGTVYVEKMLVFSAHKVSGGDVTNPAIAAELLNSTGMKLPAGAITVYDGGTYAGDALIAFLPEEEKRLISYGEDLSVTGSYDDS